MQNTRQHVASKLSGHLIRDCTTTWQINVSNGALIFNTHQIKTKSSE